MDRIRHWNLLLVPAGLALATVGLGSFAPFERAWQDPLLGTVAPPTADGPIVLAGQAADAAVVDRLLSGQPRLLVLTRPLAGVAPDPRIVRALSTTTDARGRPVAVEPGSGDGLTHIVGGSDGLVRVRRLVHEIDGVEIRSIEAIALERLGHHPGEREVEPRFAGPGGTLPHLALAAIVDGDLPADTLSGRVVFVGPTGPDRTAYLATLASEGSTVPAVEVHAQTFDALLRGRVLRTSKAASVTILLVALALAALLLVGRSVAAVALFGAILFVAASTAGVGLLLGEGLQLTLLPLVLLATGLPLAAVLVERRLLLQAIGRATVERLTAGGSSPASAGIDQPLADVAGATGAAEGAIVWEVRDRGRLPVVASAGLDRAAHERLAGRADRPPLDRWLAGHGRDPVPDLPGPDHLALGIPIRIGRRPLGVLAVFGPGSWTEDDSPARIETVARALAGWLTDRRIERIIEGRRPRLGSGQSIERRLDDLRLATEVADGRTRLRESVLSGANRGYLLTDLFGRVLLANPRTRSLCRRLGVPVETTGALAAVGRILDLEGPLPARRLLDLAVEGKTMVREVDLRSEHGLVLQVSIQPLEGADQALRILVTLADVTELTELSALRTEVLHLLHFETGSRVSRIGDTCRAIRATAGDSPAVASLVDLVERTAGEVAGLFERFVQTATRATVERTRHVKRSLLDPVALLDDWLGEHRADLEGRRIEIERTIGRERPRLGADRFYLGQALATLLGYLDANTPEGGRLVVSSTPDPREIVIDLSNRGFGLPSAEAARLLETPEIRRAPAAEEAIPLWQAARWIDEAGGQVSIEARLGEGIRFVVRLPRLP